MRCPRLVMIPRLTIKIKVPMLFEERDEIFAIEV
jgi:hypothetical protein